MARRRGFATQAPRQITWGIALVLWIVGVAVLLLHVVELQEPYALWALVIAGLLLLLGSVIDGL